MPHDATFLDIGNEEGTRIAEELIETHTLIVCPISARQLKSPADHLGMFQEDNKLAMQWNQAHPSFFKDELGEKLTPPHSKVPTGYTCTGQSALMGMGSESSSSVCRSWAMAPRSRRRCIIKM